ncbi:MAG TPA: glycosyltransferase family 39 protein [Candidatus Acidoferrales bacterium]
MGEAVVDHHFADVCEADSAVPRPCGCIDPACRSAAEEHGFFKLAFGSEEKSKDRIVRAVCLRIAFLSLLAYSIYSAATVCVVAVQLLNNQWENTYPEAPHIYTALRAAATGRLYFPLNQPPYILQSYGPLYYELGAWMARLVHGDVDRYISLARISAFGCFVLCAILIFALCKRLSFSFSVSLAAAALPMGVPLFCPWAITVRPDMYFLALMIGSLALALWDEAPSAGICIASGALGGMSFLMKQPGIVVLVAIGIVWLLHKKLRQTVFLAVGALVPVILMLALLLAHKEHFLDQYLSVGKALRSFSDASAYTWSLLRSPARLTPIGIAALGIMPAFSSERGRLIVSFTLLNWFVGLAGMPQLGAGSNYFLAGFLGCGLLLPFAFEFVRRNVNFASVMLMIVVGIGYLAGSYSIGPVFNGINMTPHPYSALAQYHILSDRPGIVLRGRNPDLLDPISVHMVELGGGGWSSAPIVQSVRNVEYDLVILACTGSRIVCNFRGVDFFAPAVVGAINANYSVFCTSSTAIVLTPRWRQVDVTAGALSPSLGAACETTYKGHTPDLVIVSGSR